MFGQNKPFNCSSNFKVKMYRAKGCFYVIPERRIKGKKQRTLGGKFWSIKRDSKTINCR